MQFDTFMLIVLAGALAAYVHLVCALWAPAIKLPSLDFSAALTRATFEDSFGGDPPWLLGFVCVHLNGAVLALLYATAIAPLLPGPPLLRGILWGMILWLAAMLLFVPMVLRDGIFASKRHPRAWITAALVHGLYGMVVGWLCPILE
ncbi:MAG: hypothetical protein OET44_09085 [Gammaproteobacteria bacterium]|nr:hypothetical protein [Gammaproteobacteria bacterium]